MAVDGMAAGVFLILQPVIGEVVRNTDGQGRKAGQKADCKYEAGNEPGNAGMSCLNARHLEFSFDFEGFRGQACHVEFLVSAA